MKANSVRTSLDIPASLHRKLHEAALRRGCSARQMILRSLERLVEEELPDVGKRARTAARVGCGTPDPACEQ